MILLVGAIIVGESTHLDFFLQDYFFDSARGTWTVDANEPVARAFFYDGPKVAIILTGVALIVLLAGPGRWRARLELTRTRLAATVLVLALVPSFVGFLKARSDVYCPAQLTRYGGTRVHQGPFQHDAANDTDKGRGHCWPAGHASGGFALLGITLLGSGRRYRRVGLALGFGLGWTMGLYQMLKGAHFLSHTVITMLLAVLVTALVARAFRIEPPAAVDKA